MEEKKSSMELTLIWFGAGVSSAEILSGMLFAPLGLSKGTAAIVIGHIIGCVLLYYAGMIGGETGRCAMETVEISFGNKGAKFFSVLNTLQLVGWTAVMIANGAAAAADIFNFSPFVWNVIIGAFIAFWILLRNLNIEKINIAAISLLFILTLILSISVFRNPNTCTAASKTLSFGAALELSIAMPVSYLPLISDYTSTAKNPCNASFLCSSVYFLISCWMYFIGMCSAVFLSSNEIAAIVIKAGLGIFGLFIIVFSTITTTYIDVYSAGICCRTVSRKFNEKKCSFLCAAVGTVVAAVVSLEGFENFLYIIGSVFTPMISILITDYFILKRHNISSKFDLLNFCVWLIGFTVYRIFMRIDLPMGSTLPAMALSAILTVFISFIKNKKRV